MDNPEQNLYNVKNIYYICIRNRDSECIWVDVKK